VAKLEHYNTCLYAPHQMEIKQENIYTLVKGLLYKEKKRPFSEKGKKEH